MMSLETIDAMSRKAARDSARDGRVPLIVWQEDIDAIREGRNARNGGIPFIGSRCPRGWKRVRLSDIDEKVTSRDWSHGVTSGGNHGYGSYFVDSSGWGSGGEAALTIGEFADRMIPGYGYAVEFAGQFQVNVAVYKKVSVDG